jgi:ParB family transcriptional regulator, chromosome partitioning protein
MTKVRGGKGLNLGAIDQYAENLRNSQSPTLLSPIDPITELDVSVLRPASWNARRYFDQRSLQMLGDDLKRNGQIHPIVVRANGETFEVVVGERRFRAAKLVGLSRLRSHVRILDDQSARRIGLSENLEREDLNAYEETVGWLDLLALEMEAYAEFSAFRKPDEDLKLAPARVLRRFHNEMFRTNHNVMVQGNTEPLPLNHNVMVHDTRMVVGGKLEEVILATFANSVRMTWQSFVKNRLPLLNLPQDLLEVLYRGEVEYTKAKEIARIKDNFKRAEVLEQTLKLNLPLAQIRDLVASVIEHPKPKVKPGQELNLIVAATFKSLGKRSDRLPVQKQVQLKALLAQIQVLLSD